MSVWNLSTHIRTTEASRNNPDYHIAIGLEIGNGALFIRELAPGMEHKGWVRCLELISRCKRYHRLLHKRTYRRRFLHIAGTCQGLGKEKKILLWDLTNMQRVIIRYLAIITVPKLLRLPSTCPTPKRELGSLSELKQYPSSSQFMLKLFHRHESLKPFGIGLVHCLPAGRQQHPGTE
jgi:hypothetical protein